MPEVVPRPTTPTAPVRPALIGAIAVCLFLVLIVHVVGVCLDGVAAIRTPLELDYGEGIVWQQAKLIPGPTMYSQSQNLPFIVFHYPPLYYLVTHLIAPFFPDLRAAGRFLSAISALATSGVAGALVFVSSRRAMKGWDRLALFSATVTVLLVLTFHAVRLWGVFMRVDMLAVALGEAGLLIGILSRGRQFGTTIALLICTAAVFTKQIALAPGLSVFAVAAIRNPRSAFGSAAVAGGIGAMVFAYLQIDTDGGFLQNIVTPNVIRMNLDHGLDVLFRQEHASLAYILPIMAAFIYIAYPLAIALRDGLRQGRLTHVFRTLCRNNPTTYAVTVLVVDFCLSTAMLPSVFKSGSSVDYLMEWLIVGAVFLGILLCRLAAAGHLPRLPLIFTGVVVLLTAASQPFRMLPDNATAERLNAQLGLISRIAEADKPVASENMSLIIQAGKTVMFEPFIVTELVRPGKWDEAPLVDKIRAGGFAFFLTTDDNIGGTDRRSAAVDAAMRAAYPVTEPTGLDLWIHLPLPGKRDGK